MPRWVHRASPVSASSAISSLSEVDEKDTALGHGRRGPGRCVEMDAQQLLAGFAVEHDQLGIAGRDVKPAVVEGEPAAPATLVLVLWRHVEVPQGLAGLGIERGHGGVRVDGIDPPCATTGSRSGAGKCRRPGRCRAPQLVERARHVDVQHRLVDQAAGLRPVRRRLRAAATRSAFHHIRVDGQFVSSWNTGMRSPGSGGGGGSPNQESHAPRERTSRTATRTREFMYPHRRERAARTPSCAGSSGVPDRRQCREYAIGHGVSPVLRASRPCISRAEARHGAPAAASGSSRAATASGSSVSTRIIAA